MKNVGLLLLLVAGTFVLGSCKKDEKKSDTANLRATWDANSFLVDGEEQVPLLFSAFTIRLDEVKGGEGDFRFTWIYNPALGLPTEITNGRYTVNEERREIRFIFSDGSSDLMDYTLDKDNLELEGNLDGFNVRIRLKRT